MSDPRFGISSRLFQDARLCRDHLVHIAAHGFEAFELFATRPHFDYRSEPAVTELAEWLSDTRLTLHAVHAPADEALEEIEAVLALARVIPFRFLVVHLADATKTRVERLAELAAASNVKVALETLNDSRADAAMLVRIIEDELDEVDVGICLDFGHAHLRGDLNEAIELVAGHLLTTHVHDNGGRRDDHLVPYAGNINWDSALMETQKIGYEGVLMFEPAASGDPVDVIKRCAKARERLEKAFVIF